FSVSTTLVPLLFSTTSHGAPPSPPVPYTTLFRSALFLNARGGRLSRQSAWKILGTSAQRAGVQSDVSPHTLRAARWCLKFSTRSDRKSTRLNSSHVSISYAVFCLKKKTQINDTRI